MSYGGLTSICETDRQTFKDEFVKKKKKKTLFQICDDTAILSSVEVAVK